MSSTPNVFPVEDRNGSTQFWRGGQPPDALAWSEIADLLGDGGTVLKLNTDGQGDDSVAEHDYGLRVVRIEISDAEQLFSTPKGDLRRAVDICLANRLLFVHCTHGQDRTGLIVGLYRLACGWSRDDAWAEMEAHGFHRALLGLYSAWEQWRPEASVP